MQWSIRMTIIMRADAERRHRSSVDIFSGIDNDVVCFGGFVLWFCVFDRKSAGGKFRQGLSDFFLAITSSFSIPLFPPIGINT